ncbi:MAG: T9SS type A sorting domain-containing protein [FCB group bacterium]|nr:T9SS type A sorting domain-containing protein [FCB group bacterium]
MKSFAYIFLILLALAATATAQSDPFGEIDTIYLDQQVVNVGREFTVSVSLWNDEDLGGLTLPFDYPMDKMDFISIDYSGGRVDYIKTKIVQVDDSINGTILGGVVRVFEDDIPAGNGLICTLKFKLKDDVIPDEVLVIDSTSIGPAYLLITYKNGNNIYPVFRRGEITVGVENQSPYFTPVPELYVAEGDSLYIDIEASDPEGDPLTIANPVHPYNSEFIDNGDGSGRFAWRPDFVGPLSSDLSPFYFVFWASDGSASGYQRVKVNVINVNRAPEITAPAKIVAESGDTLAFGVSALDPDFEPITWTIDGLPSGATFDFNHPGMINWPSQYADSGLYKISLIAADSYGLADTAEIEIEMVPVTFYRLQLDTLTTFSGEVVTIDLFLKTEFELKEFDLLVNLDPAILTTLTITTEGGLAEEFDYFQYQLDYNGVAGDIRLHGRAETADPIGESDGLLIRLTAQVSSNLTYVGNQVPLPFVWHLSTDNRLVLSDNQVVYDDEINFFDGYLLIAAPGDILLGDINLNGVAYEISDAVYFSNYFIMPSQYPMNQQQLLNSDANRDGFVPSVADLVVLIKVITGETAPKIAVKSLPNLPRVKVELIRNNDGLFVQTEASIPMGAAFFSFTGEDAGRLNPVNMSGLELKAEGRNDRFNCLLFSYDGETISSGTTSLIKLSDDGDLHVSLDRIDLADADGNVLTANKTEDVILPKSFVLHQNYPNPFNPATQISFNLEVAEWVKLSVYNILGQEIIRLADEEYPAGAHTVIWDGDDEDGRRVASGIYLYRLVAGNNSASRKMVLMK